MTSCRSISFSYGSFFRLHTEFQFHQFSSFISAVDGISVSSVFFVYLSRGTQHFTGTVSNEATSEMGYPVWPTGRTCSVCQLSSTWQRAKPRTLLTNLFVFDDLVQVFFPVVAIWTHVYWDFTFSQNRVLNRLLQVSEVSLYLLWRNDI